MDIIGGSSSQLLASRIANESGARLILTEFKEFPDGEQYTRILEKPDTDVVIIQSVVKDPDFITLLQLIDACEDADKITVVIPYMGYARQDKRFKDGEAITSRALARAINADQVILVNIHNEEILKYFNAPAKNLDATGMVGEYLKELKLAKPIVIAPDGGAIGIARNAAEILGTEYDHLEKKRLSGERVTITPKKLDIEEKDIILIDDIISTGGTIAEAISIFKSEASSIHVACVHPALTGNAVLRLFHAGVASITSTDTIEKGTSKVSIAPLVAD
ncbi:ribose-phosphate diphosphokinase, partial [Methanosarcinales archaeon]